MKTPSVPSHAGDSRRSPSACVIPRSIPSGFRLLIVLAVPLLATCGRAAPEPKQANPPAAKPTVTITAEENLAKIYLKLPSKKLLETTGGEADGLLRAVPWRSIKPDGAAAPQVRMSFGAEFKRGTPAADALAKAGETEPFFAEQRVVQCTADDCKALIRLIDSLESAKFEKAPESIKFRTVAAGYGDFRFKKSEDGKVEIYAYTASAGEIWAPVELPELRKTLGAILGQLEQFAKSPQTISLK